MYYIVNLDNQVVAADSDLLSWLKIDNLQELFARLARSELKFNELDSSTLEIVAGTNTAALTQNRYPLSTLMGDLILVKLSEIKEATFTPVDLPEETDNEIKFIIDDKEEDETTHEDINLLPDEEIDFLKPVEESAIEKEESTLALSDESIVIDTEKVSELLGITRDDYSGFFDEFIDKAIELEDAVRDTESAEHHKAVLSLSELAQMLHLAALSDILEKVEKESGEKKKRAIEAFYHKLSSLTTQTTHTTQPNDTVLEPVNEKYDHQICDLVLENVKLIHFDFQIEQASEELSLPVDLIEEFVNDFIVQAHEEKINFIDACKKGDIDDLHRIGHKLKGVASNLRITPLAETLEEIQLCEDKSRFEPLLKKYWGQFMAFELYMHGKLHHQGRK